MDTAMPNIKVFDNMSYCVICKGKGRSRVEYFVDFSSYFEPFKVIAYTCSCGYSYNNRNYETYIAKCRPSISRQVDKMQDVRESPGVHNSGGGEVSSELSELLI